MNKITNLFGIKYPIIQSPMAGVQKSAMTIAVCNSGCLGSLPCAMLTPQEIRDELINITKQTSGPYNVNFFCNKQPCVNFENEQNWKAKLEPYYQEFGLNQQSLEIESTPQRIPFSNEIVDILEEFKPPVISFHFGLPSKDLLNRIRSWDSKIISSATTVEEAIWLEQQGVDAIIAQGVEAGGHRGMFLSNDITTQLGLISLLPQILNVVKVPVIAAGGIADSKTVAACIRIGASAVQMGTVFLLCNEAQTSNVHRQAIQSINSRHTALTNIFIGKPARSIVNKFMKDMDYMSPNVPEFPRAALFLLPLKQKAESINNGDFSSLWSGQNTSNCQNVPCSEIIQDLIKDLDKIQ